jgi:lysophospholipase L1-like esterase
MTVPERGARRRTVLFFGDSVTRGYGVGRERRFAALVAERLRERSASRWTFDVAATSSDFAVYGKHLDVHLRRHRPEVLVCQCPGGPACFFPRFPGWTRRLIALEQRLFERLTERYIEAEVRGHGEGGRSRRESLYEGLYLDRLHRWQPSNWPIVGRWWRARASRYPSVPKVTCAEYLDRMRRVADQVRERGVPSTLFIGLLPMAEDVCPGYRGRARGWCAELKHALDAPERGSHFLDVLAALGDGDFDRLLLGDRIHLSAEGHRAVATLVAPALAPLLPS